MFIAWKKRFALACLSVSMLSTNPVAASFSLASIPKYKFTIAAGVVTFFSYNYLFKKFITRHPTTTALTFSTLCTIALLAAYIKESNNSDQEPIIKDAATQEIRNHLIQQKELPFTSIEKRLQSLQTKIEHNEITKGQTLDIIKSIENMLKPDFLAQHLNPNNPYKRMAELKNQKKNQNNQFFFGDNPIDTQISQLYDSNPAVKTFCDKISAINKEILKTRNLVERINNQKTTQKEKEEHDECIICLENRKACYNNNGGVVENGLICQNAFTGIPHTGFTCKKCYDGLKNKGLKCPICRGELNGMVEEFQKQ